MRCKFCGFANGEDDHRCLRCGRRSAGTVISAPAAFSGNNALALEPALHAEREQSVAPQPTLFPAATTNVIPFDRVQRPATARSSVPDSPATPVTRKTVGSATEQIPMDFIRAGLSSARTLKTAVPAQIYCDHPVATPIHRSVAGAMDAAMILLGFGLFIVMAQFTGGSFGEGKLFWGMIVGSFALISLFYGLIWSMCGRETAGMAWTELRLVTFDGFAVDRKTRAVRHAATWLSFCAGGIGILWATADEEKLTWHDHISKTFPTIREASGSFHRPSR